MTKITVKSVRKPVPKPAKKQKAEQKSPQKQNKVQDKQKFLFNVDQNLAFYLNDGRRLYNLRDLENALQGMNGALFQYHANEKKNDFANWIQNVFGYVELADNLRKVKTVNEALKKVQTGIQ